MYVLTEKLTNHFRNYGIKSKFRPRQSICSKRKENKLWPGKNSHTFLAGLCIRHDNFKENQKKNGQNVTLLEYLFRLIMYKNYNAIIFRTNFNISNMNQENDEDKNQIVGKVMTGITESQKKSRFWDFLER